MLPNPLKSLFLMMYPSLQLRVTGLILTIQESNGWGKSTLIKIIVDLIQPDEGSTNINGNAIVGYLDQEIRDFAFRQVTYFAVEGRFFDLCYPQGGYTKFAQL
jgi:ABC-type transport system involved in cytochrome c biogenesis ATPase subunit